MRANSATRDCEPTANRREEVSSNICWHSAAIWQHLPAGPGPDWRIFLACRMGPSKLNTGIAGSIRLCGAPSLMRYWPLACSGSFTPVRLSTPCREISGSGSGSVCGEAGACTPTGAIRTPRPWCLATYPRSTASASPIFRSALSAPMRPNSSRTPRRISTLSLCRTSTTEPR